MKDFTLLITFKTYSFVNVPTDIEYYLADISNHLLQFFMLLRAVYGHSYST